MMSSPDYLLLLKLVAPEALVVVAALAVLFADLGVMREQPRRYRLLIAVAASTLGCLAALLWLSGLGEPANFQEGMLVLDPLTRWVKAGLLVLTVLTVWVSLDSPFTEHVGEYFALLLIATAGLMFLVSSEDILMIFVALELTSISLYILVALDKHAPQAAEAALKYFLFGGVAAAVTLFGLSLLYGLSGATRLGAIAASLGAKASDPAVRLALVMVATGFAFKVAAVPFHLWAPDAYQKAPTPAAALIASGSKLASFFLLAKVMALGFAGVEGSSTWQRRAAGWVPLLATLAVSSMILGNLAALAQRSVRRLLAYSAVAHAGYLLLGIVAMGHASQRQEAMAALLYYAATYGLTVVGAFAAIAVVEQTAGADNLADFAGLSRRAPLLSLCLLVFMLSLAGIPPLAGFFGKFYVFTAVAGSDQGRLGLLWLVILALALSTVSLYYYLQVLKQVYVVPAPARTPSPAVNPFQQAVVGIIALGVLVLGALPDLLLRSLDAAIKAAGF